MKKETNVRQELANKFKSECNRYGVTEFEDYLQKCIETLGYSCQRGMVFCFCCRGMWQHLGNEFPDECWNCGTKYDRKGLYCMPDIIIGDKGVIFVQGWRHDRYADKLKDKEQIRTLKEAGYQTFVIYNEEIAYMRHANRCFMMIGYLHSLDRTDLYQIAFRDEKELPK